MPEQAPIDLEGMVQELAQGIRNYPQTSAEAIMGLVSRLGDNLSYGEKQSSKNRLIELLGFNTGNWEIRGSLRTIAENVIYFKDIGMGDPSKAIARYPHILQVDVGKMKQRIEYLLSVGVQEEDIPRIISRCPQILRYDVETRLKPVVEYLKSIGLTREDVGIMISISPGVLGLSVERNLKPKYEFLRDKFNLTAEDLVWGAFLLYSLEKRIKPRYGFLKSKGLEKKYSAITVLNCNDEKLCRWMHVPLSEYLAFKRNYLAKGPSPS